VIPGTDDTDAVPAPDHADTAAEPVAPPADERVETTPSAEAETETEDGSRRRQRLLAGICIVLLLLFVFSAVMASVFKGRLDDERRTRRRVREVSANMVTALMTYDFAKLDESRQRVLSLSTGRFRKEYDEGSAPLRTVLTQTQSRSTGRVNQVFIGDIANDSAQTVVIADQVLTGVAGTRALTGQQLTLSLVRLGNGDWKVDGLSVDVPSGADATGGSTGNTGTTTTTR
jgi:Mce-associated membrane protein